MKRNAGRLLAVCPLFPASACTIINVDGADRHLIVAPGILSIAPAPGASMLTYRTRGLGLVLGRKGTTLGWASEDAAIVYDPSQCHVVVFRQTDMANSELWRTLIDDHPDICIVGEKP